MNDHPSRNSATHQKELAKPDIRRANLCPPLPKGASGLDTIVYWLGIGLGSGLPQRAPGTWGTVGGWLVAVPLMMLGFIPFLIITIIASVVGVWICGRTSELMNVHDDPHIVWDEWAGMWLTLLPISYMVSYLPHLMTPVLYWVHMVLAFILFRIFDIAKIGPVRWADTHLSGGMGILIDDIFAGLMAMMMWGVLLAIILTLYPPLY